MVDKIKLTHRFANIAAVKNAYMSFVYDGGIFIPTDHVFHLGDEVEVSLTLPQNPKTFSFIAEVIWITPHSARQTVGIGVSSHDIESEAFQAAAKNLINTLKTDDHETQSSETM